MPSQSYEQTVLEQAVAERAMASLTPDLEGLIDDLTIYTGEDLDAARQVLTDFHAGVVRGIRLIADANGGSLPLDELIGTALMSGFLFGARAERIRQRRHGDHESEVV